MFRDRQGLTLSTASREAAEAFNAALGAYVGYRADGAQHLARALAADGEFGLAHCLGGYVTMLSYKRANLPSAAAAARSARAAKATPREKAHGAALEAWIAGDLDRALAVWEEILVEHPTDLLAFRLAHFNNFWLGRAEAMRDSAERVAPRWARDVPDYGTILSCRCFAAEECGDYAAAEPLGRAALETDSADLWGVHALTHVLEMQGRRQEGLDLLAAHEEYFAGGNNFIHHLWWHAAMFRLEQRDFDAVLELYDRRFRNLASPLTQALPDLYIDVQNAASMLFRLERQGVDVRQRWFELADKAEQRIGDCLSAFTQPHWIMALAAAGRLDAARRMLEAMRDFGRSGGTVAEVVGDVALPVSEAVLAHRCGEPARAVALMTPVLDKMHRLGGSHAQRDVLEQLYLDAAMKAGRDADIRGALARAAASRWRTPPENRVGYAAAAAQFHRQ